MIAILFIRPEYRDNSGIAGSIPVPPALLSNILQVIPKKVNYCSNMQSSSRFIVFRYTSSAASTSPKK